MTFPFEVENRTTFKKTITEICLIIIGTAMIAFTYYLFMKPNNIMAPGLGGIAIIIAQFIPLSLGVLYFILNIPLFLLGFRFVGWKFVINSLVGMFSLSFFLSLFEFLIGFNQPIVGAASGGILNGAFLGIVLLAGGSTGGLDIAFIVINKQWPKFTIGKIMFFINGIVVTVSGILFGFKSFIFTVLSIYLAGKALDVCFSLWPEKTNEQDVTQKKD